MILSQNPCCETKQTSHSKMDNSYSSKPKHYQSIIVMRHGERIDYFDDSWRSEAARPWDPQLIPEGHSRALSTGQKLQTRLGFPIHRVFTSPFLRCVETASGVVSGLCADNNIGNHTSKNNPPSNIKASVQWGLCEAFNIITVVAPPKEGEEWGFNLTELETLFPVGTVDPESEQVIPELPKWEEALVDARGRFLGVIHALADKYPTENLLLITHGEALRGVVSTFSSNLKCRHIDYCGYLQLRREITHMNNNESFQVGKFEFLTDFSHGIHYTTPGHDIAA